MTALETTPAAVDYIPLCAPTLCGNEWRYVKQCLDSGWVSSVGAFVDRFEREFAERIGAKHAIAAVNGTSALHIALLLAGVQPDDEVLVSALTFIAPANAVRYAGAWPVFIDAEPIYWQMDPERTVDFLERKCIWKNSHLSNKLTGRRVKAILPVHILGHPVDIDPIADVAKKYGLALIEDATESLGASYKGRPVGLLGDIACFSFNGNKLMTTGGGGMLITDDAERAARAKHLTTQAKLKGLEFIHDEVGYNYRLPNLLAAMGCAQLELLDSFLAAKRRIAAAYARAFHGVAGLTLMPEAPHARSSYWLYTLMISQQEFGVDSRALIQRLRELNIESRPLWQPMHHSPPHGVGGEFECPAADRLYEEGVSLPCSVGLAAGDQQRVIDAVLAGRSN